MANITVKELTIEKKPLKEKKVSQHGKNYETLSFFGYEVIKDYKGGVFNKYYKIELFCGDNTIDIQKELLSFDANDIIFIEGEIFGGTEIELSTRTQSRYVKTNMGSFVIKPQKVKLVKKAEKEKTLEDMVDF